jgi:hypothetical protein
VNIIFLDIDGVINNWGDWDKRDDLTQKIIISKEGFCKESIEAVNEIQTKFDAKIVLSSTWRIDKENLEEVKSVFDIYDITPKIGKRRLSQYIPRWQEIILWLQLQESYPEKIVILDDDSDASNFFLKPYHFLTNNYIGLRLSHIEEVSAIFNQKIVGISDVYEKRCFIKDNTYYIMEYDKEESGFIDKGYIERNVFLPYYPLY